MKVKERFEELSEALRQAKAVRRGDAAPSRVWNVTRGSNGQLHRRQLDPKAYQQEQRAEWENTVSATRSRLRLSQNKFAAQLGISVKTLHNWEQGAAQNAARAESKRLCDRGWRTLAGIVARLYNWPFVWVKAYLSHDTRDDAYARAI